jgi:hypothetical protein
MSQVNFTKINKGSNRVIINMQRKTSAKDARYKMFKLKTVNMEWPAS